MASDKKSLCFLIDTTSSMNLWIDTLRDILPSIIRATRLTSIFDHISILTYTDYDQSSVTKFSGFCDTMNHDDMNKLTKFAANLFGKGGAGLPEAVKTALVEFSKNPYNGKTCMIHLT